MVHTLDVSTHLLIFKVYPILLSKFDLKRDLYLLTIILLWTRGQASKPDVSDVLVAKECGNRWTRVLRDG